jgi:hypothetical protein
VAYLIGQKQARKRGGKDMDGRVSITITTDKPVKIKVMPDDQNDATGKEAEGLKRLLNEINGGGNNVVPKREIRANDKK